MRSCHNYITRGKGEMVTFEEKVCGDELTAEFQARKVHTVLHVQIRIRKDQLDSPLRASQRKHT